MRVGGDDVAIKVTACKRGPGPKDPPNAKREFILVGSGRSGGLNLTLHVTRYRTEVIKGKPAITETVTVSAGTGMHQTGLEASRSLADGRWTDLRDLKARTALIARDGDNVRVTARFGAAGTTNEDKLNFGTLRARCP